MNHRKVDKEIFVKTMSIFYYDYAKKSHYWLRDLIENHNDGKAEEFFAKVYESSFLSNPQQAEKLLKNFKPKNVKKLINDPAVELFLPIWGRIVMT